MLADTSDVEAATGSLSARRAWIEISKTVDHIYLHWSLSARRAWIEITVVGVLATLVTSLSARRAWIEIRLSRADTLSYQRRSPQGGRG